MNSFFKDLFTDNEGQFDIVSVMGVISMLTFLGLSVYNVIYKDVQFDYVNFGIGASSLLAALGTAYHFKSNLFSKEK